MIVIDISYGTVCLFCFVLLFILVVILLKDAHIFLISKMPGPRFRSQCLSSSRLAHPDVLCLSRAMSAPHSALASAERGSLDSPSFFPFLFLICLLSWPPFLKRKLTFTDTFDQLGSVSHLVHLDPFRRAPARPYVFVLLFFFGGGWAGGWTMLFCIYLFLLHLLGGTLVSKIM